MQNMMSHAAKLRLVVGFLPSIAVVVICLIFTSGANAKEGDARQGKDLYQTECVVCHGAGGDGNGPAAPFLSSKPRDFTRGIFKLRSTPDLPTDEDLYNTLSKGIPGTLMPAFSHLSSEDRWALVAYLKGFSENFREARSLEPITIPPPPPQTDELVASGSRFYKDFGCDKCHGPGGEGDGPAAATLTDDWGSAIVPYDLTIPGKMRGGSSVKDIYRTLAVGIGGTPMPAYGEFLNDEQIWALAYYVRSLAEEAWPATVSGDPVIGRDLFIGNKRFERGGASCRACHSFGGIGALGGGVLGPDLTPSYLKFGEDGLATVLTDLPFPVMRSVFNTAALSDTEKAHLRAFFAQGKGRAPERIFQLAGIGTAGAVVFYLMISFLWRTRGGEVRHSMYEQSYKNRGEFV